MTVFQQQNNPYTGIYKGISGIFDPAGPGVFSQYADDWVGCIENELGAVLTDGIRRVIKSVQENQVTIVRSANGVGKTHGGARLAAAFYKIYPDSKVFTCAAPPESNLKRLLWGEMASLVQNNQALFETDVVRSMHIRRENREESFITGVSIPTHGTAQSREARFCADADELFELTSGELVPYRDLIGKEVKVMSVSKGMKIESAVARFFDNGKRNVWEIILGSGQRLVRTGEHPFWIGVVERDYRTHGGTHVKGRVRVEERGWVHTEDLQEGDALLVPDNTAFNFGEGALDPNEVKVLAYLIGDGCINDGKRVLFFQENNAQLKEFKQAVSFLDANVTPYNLEQYAWKVVGDGSGRESNTILNLLRNHGVCGLNSADKHIPDSIFTSGRSGAALFLNRLFSTDGWACMVKVGKRYKKAEIGYVSKSERLVRDIQRLLHRFGIHATIRPTRKSWTHNGQKKWGSYWNLTITRANDVLRFANEIGIYGKEESIEACRAYSSSRQENAAWRRSAPEGFAWDRIKSIRKIGKRPTVGAHVPGNNTYLTCAVEHNSGKHAPQLLFIVDEGDAVPPEVFKGIESCMSGGLARLVIFFNPREKLGRTWELEYEGLANVVEISAIDHPNVREKRDVIPGAVTHSKTVQRYNLWTRPLFPGEEPKKNVVVQLPDFLVGDTAEMPSGEGSFPPLPAGPRVVTENAFWYMVLAQYPPTSDSQLINFEWIEAAVQRMKEWRIKHGDAKPNARPIMGLDVADLGQDKTVACIRWGGYPIFESWQGVDPTKSAQRGAELYHQYDVRHANVDALGVGAGVPTAMSVAGCRSVSGVRVSERSTKYNPLGVFNKRRDELWWAMREWLRTDETAMLPDNKDLIKQLSTPVYLVRGGRIMVSSKEEMKTKNGGQSPDLAEALMLTLSFSMTGFYSV